MEPTEFTALGKFVYICGKSHPSSVIEYFSLKGKLIADLSVTCFVRTHACPVADMVDAYCAIASSSAFVFILNDQTLYDPECLNQLGIAMLYNVPIVAVRLENFELPKPLPLRFYETRFVDKRSSGQSAKKDSNEIPLTLAGVILGCYETSIVCKTSAYMSFLEELVRTLSNKAMEVNGNLVAENCTANEDGTGKTESRSAAQARLARIGLGSSRPSRKGQRNGTANSSAINKQKGLQNIYGADNKLLSRQLLVNRFAHKKIDLTLSSVPSSFNRNGKKPYKIIGRQAFQREQTFGSVRGKENRIGLNQNSSKGDDNFSMLAKQKTVITTSSLSDRITNLVEVSKATSGSAQNLTTVSMKSENGLAVPIVGPKGRKLRRYSSLPVVPTQYLVASDKKSESPQILSFPPSNTSPGSESPYYFSGDELDFDPIHISRTCTPVDAFESTSLPDSIENSSR